MKKGVIFVLLLTLVQVYSSKDLFAAVTQLEDVFQNEQTVLSHLERLIDQFQQNIDGLKQTLSDIRKSRLQVTDVSQYLQNPLNSFVYVKSIIDYWPFLVESLQPIFGIASVFYETETSGTWPTQQDLEGAAAAILRLKTTYNLDTDQLIQGKIRNQISSPLDAVDCILIGEVAYSNGDYKEASVWLQKAYELCFSVDKKGKYDVPFKINITEYLAYTEFMTGDFNKSLELTNNLLELQPDHERANVNKRYLSEEINNVPHYERTGEFMVDPFGNIDTDKYYFYCCRGMARPKVKNVSKLTCQYVHYNNPYLMIGPIKEEEVYSEPRIVLMRDILFDSEIKEIQNASKSLLERSSTQDGVMDHVRVSKVAWLEAEHSDLADKLTNRLSAYADLSSQSAEALQVVNYGLGGHYLYHYDAFDENSTVEHWGSSIGNRIATLLVYMNDVDEGGDTVFTRLGLSVKPEKGTAVLWYNLYNNGSIDLDSQHAACPVLLGTKWAINLWFHEVHNEFTKFCRIKD